MALTGSFFIAFYKVTVQLFIIIVLHCLLCAVIVVMTSFYAGREQLTFTTNFIITCIKVNTSMEYYRYKHQ